MSRIREISYDAGELAITWENAGRSELQAIWLRDHCQMPASRDPGNGQRLLNINDISPDIAIDKASLEDGKLIVEFGPDGHRSEFDPDWLYRNCYCLNRQYDDRSETSKLLWRSDSFSETLPRHAYPNYCEQARSKLAALQAVRDYGFVLLDSVPCEPGQILKVIETFGFVRETNYGPLFEVRTRVDPNNLAYTNLGLGCHLDNPYRDPVPGLQLLHCLESSTEGGESILQDGFMAATILRQENPGHFATLSHNWINFRFRDDSADLQSRVPLIEVNDRNEVIKVRFNNRSIDTIMLAPDQIQQFYSAYRHYAEILERAELQVVFKLQPGELLLFDNTRVLHARKAYLASGSRHLQGAYSDLDGLYSSLRILESG
ncbi:MAG: gamma-butyrobetaine dioxygenase [Gammaproteobacteria bacterium]|jgi:gamma-butyrobetaine dioxygenase|nr:gamma-butyrobetaine dioxygenase [Gammaproteobacteria bacterium]